MEKSKLDKLIKIINNGNVLDFRNGYKPNDNRLIIRENLFNTIIDFKSDDGWYDISTKISFTDIDDEATYQVLVYREWYDYASDPPFESRPAIIESTLENAVNVIIDKL